MPVNRTCNLSMGTEESRASSCRAGTAKPTRSRQILRHSGPRLRRFRGEADINQQATPADSVENAPQRTSAVETCSLGLRSTVVAAMTFAIGANLLPIAAAV